MPLIFPEVNVGLSPFLKSWKTFLNKLSFLHFHLPLLSIGEVQRPEILIGDRVCVSGEGVEALHHDLLQDFRVGD